MPKPALNQIDQYIAAFPPHTREALEQVRITIRQAAPEAEEVISYKMPAYKFHGMLIYFAGYGKHIGLYPTASGIEKFEKALSKYKHARGSVQFPLDQPMPLALISKIVRFRVKENLAVSKAFASHSRQSASSQDFLSALPAPARRILLKEGINTLSKLAKHTEAEILSLHGMGPSSLPKLRNALKAEGRSFKK